jgi:hypothetical protein
MLRHALDWPGAWIPSLEFRRHLARHFLDETGAVQIECRIPPLIEGERRHGFPLVSVAQTERIL